MLAAFHPRHRSRSCRTFTAGWYRPTATFLTPSAAYGLLLNLAGIESGCARGTRITTAATCPPP